MLKDARLPSCQRQQDCLPFDVLGSDLHLLRPLRGTCTKSEESARRNRAQKGCCAFLLTSGGAKLKQATAQAPTALLPEVGAL
jgi:hypothetical protein